MDAHDVFDPSKTSQDRQAAWVPVADDVNRWAEEADGVTCADRSALALVYKKYKEGSTMLEIATGPSEKTDDEWKPVLTGLAEQWEEQLSREGAKKDESRRHEADRERGRSAQQNASDELGELDDAEDEDGDDTAEQSTAVKTRAKPTGTTLLSTTIGTFVTEQGRSARAERDVRASQHQATLEEAREAREEQQRQHREEMRREDRRLELEEERL
ncbi:hypothetical protein V8E36_004165 [Tilletia maclaganii]